MQHHFISIDINVDSRGTSKWLCMNSPLTDPNVTDSHVNAPAHGNDDNDKARKKNQTKERVKKYSLS